MEQLAIMTAVRNWYQALNDQVDGTVLLGMLSARGFSLTFPEATLTDEEGFLRWYEGVKTAFFDESHLVRHLHIEIEDARANLAVWVNWQALTRPEGSAQAQALDFDAMQEWEMRREEGRWVIARYNVVELADNLKRLG